MRLEIEVAVGHLTKPLPAHLDLLSVADLEYQNAQLGLRHPAAVYALALRAVSEALDRFMVARECERSKYFQRDANRDPEKTLLALDALLDAVVEHFDDCESVLKIITYGDRKYQQKVLREWLKTNRSCRDFFAKQVNAIKHGQARLRAIEFAGDGWLIDGYFVEGVLPDGAVGPRHEIHPNGDSAFSYYRLLTTLICAIVFSSRTLSVLLHENGVRAGPSIVGVGIFADATKKIAELEARVFPDEIKGCVGKIQETRGSFRISFPWEMHPRYAPPLSGRCKFTLGGDGYSNKFKLPYFSSHSD